MICTEELKNDDSVLLHKTRRQSHRLCYGCFDGTYADNLKQKIVQLKTQRRPRDLYLICPGSINSHLRNNCKHKVRINDINYNMVVGNIFLNLQKIQFLLSMGDQYHLCPNEKCGDIVEIPKEYHRINVFCFRCKTSWCSNCKITPFHDDKSCIESSAEMRNTDTGKYLWKMFTSGKMKYCPGCNSPISKESGCNKMLCIHCGIKWCWLCRMANIDYDHFTKVDNCRNRLWEK
jgi:hypothetical protein